jgi:hypothetical protein
MIGNWAFVVAIGAVVATVWGAIVAIRVWKSNRKSVVLLFLTCVLLVAGVAVRTKFINQARNIDFLRTMNAQNVSSISVGGSIISDEPKISEVVAALNRVQWFRSDHGGWAQPVSVQITLTSGDVMHSRLSYYLKQEGAVLIFYRRYGTMEFRDGYAYSPDLQKVLFDLGITLPKKK